MSRVREDAIDARGARATSVTAASVREVDRPSPTSATCRPGRFRVPFDGRRRGGRAPSPTGSRRPVAAPRDPAARSSASAWSRVDRNPDALWPRRRPMSPRWSTSPTSGAVLTEVRADHGIDGVLTVSADRAVPVGRRARRGARAAGDRRRDRPPDDAQDRDAAPARGAGVPQPRFAAIATSQSGRARARRGRASRRCSSRPTPAASAVSSYVDSRRRHRRGHLHAALAASPTRRRDPRGVRRRASS